MPDTDTYRALASLRADLSIARQAIVELDDALAALRAEHDAFRQHAAANLASLNELAAELTAEVAKDPEFTKMTVGVLRALTWNLGFQFRGEPVPGDWDDGPDAFYARLAGETEADRPEAADSDWYDPNSPVTQFCPRCRARQHCNGGTSFCECPCTGAKAPAECDGSSDCPGVVVWHWRSPSHPDQIVELCDEHAKDKDLSDLVDLRSIEVPW